MAYSKVIVFGPTGNVGSVAAQSANSKGAKVYLAMRNTSKAIPGLTSAAEQAGNYERIQADLLQPETVLTAVQKSGAQAAFLYLAHGSPDHMQGTIRALKDGGVKHVVFLSSFTVPKERNLADIPPSDFISYLHAQAELNLRQTFAKEALVALRPGFFATNIVREKPGIQARKAGLYGPGNEFDFITYEDMGEVAGTSLVEGQRGGEDVIYLLGPKMLDQKTSIQIIGKVLGVEIDTPEIDADQYVRQLVQFGLSEPIAKHLADVMGETMAQGGKMSLDQIGLTHEEGYENVRKYLGRPAMEFEEWVSKNKELFV